MGDPEGRYIVGEAVGTDETERRLLAAAAQVFAEQGYARATTRALAAAAGVNEVTLFRRFGSKQGLFSAVIDQFAAPALTTEIEARLTGDLVGDLRVMAEGLMGMMLQRREAVRLMLCEAAHFPELQEVLARNPRQLRRLLADYLSKRIEDGQVRALHAEAMAQAFWGMFFAYGIMLSMLDEPLRPDIDLDSLVEQFVSLFADGIRPRQ